MLHYSPLRNENDEFSFGASASQELATLVRIFFLRNLTYMCETGAHNSPSSRRHDQNVSIWMFRQSFCLKKEEKST